MLIGKWLGDFHTSRLRRSPTDLNGVILTRSLNEKEQEEETSEASPKDLQKTLNTLLQITPVDFAGTCQYTQPCNSAPTIRTLTAVNSLMDIFWDEKMKWCILDDS